MKTLEGESGRTPERDDTSPIGVHLLVAYLSYAVADLYLHDNTAGLLLESAIYRLNVVSSGGAKAPGARL